MKSSLGTLFSKFESTPFLVRLGVGVLLLNLFVIAMATVSLRQSRRHHRDQALATAQNLSQVLDRYVADTFSKADLAVWAVKDEAEHALAHPGDRGHDLDAFLRRQHGRAPELMALRTTNAQGVIDHETGAGAGATLSVADREYFIRLRDVPDVGLVISEPLHGKVTGRWGIILARRLEAPDHRFAGIAYAVIALEQFDKAFSSLDVGPNGSVALRGLDLGLIARYPEPVSAGTAIGQRVVSKELMAFAQSGQSTGIYEAVPPFDGVKRTFSVRRVSDQPLYLLVGLAERDFMSGWRREAVQQLTVVSLFICLTLLASWLIQRAWMRQQAAHDRLQHLLAEVKTLSGMMPICSHCKKVRDDKGYWNQIEAYLNERTDAEFTHGICPDCAKDVFPKASGRFRTL